MKRDMDLIREILLKIEETENKRPIIDLCVENYSDEEVSYHCKLLYEAGFVCDYKNTIDGSFGVGQMTWNGQEFLDTVKSDTIWNKTKETITKKGLPMGIDILKSVATSIIQSMITTGV